MKFVKFDTDECFIAASLPDIMLVNNKDELWQTTPCVS